MLPTMVGHATIPARPIAAVSNAYSTRSCPWSSDASRTAKRRARLRRLGVGV